MSLLKNKTQNNEKLAAPGVKQSGSITKVKSTK